MSDVSIGAGFCVVLISSCSFHLFAAHFFSVSLVSVLAGGATNFVSDKEENSSSTMRMGVIPMPGRVLMFEHRLLHEGEEVKEGVKYVLRSDIMFRRRKK